MHRGIVRQAKTIEIRARLAPILQSFPTSLGNTIVFNPQGIQYIKSADKAISLFPKGFNTETITKGITISLNRDIMYDFLSHISSLKLNSETAIPVKIILMGAIQLLDFVKIEEIVFGSVSPEIPKTHPKTIAITTGFDSFFRDSLLPVSIENPAVYVNMEIGSP